MTPLDREFDSGGYPLHANRGGSTHVSVVSQIIKMQKEQLLFPALFIVHSLLDDKFHMG